MLINMAAEMIEKLENELKEADPEEREHFIKSAFSLLQAITGESKKLV